MRMIIVTRKIDGARTYINPLRVCAIYPNYNTGATVIQFSQEENYFEVIESVDTVASMVEDAISERFN